MPPVTGIDITHAPELAAAADVFEQFVYAQFAYDPESGAPTAKIAIQSPACGLVSPEKVNVDAAPAMTVDGLALRDATGVGVRVGVVVIAATPVVPRTCRKTTANPTRNILANRWNIAEFTTANRPFRDWSQCRTWRTNA